MEPRLCFSWVSQGQEGGRGPGRGQEATRQTIANQNIALALN